MTTKSIFPILAALTFTFFTNTVFAQNNDGIAKGLGLYVFPPDGKDAEAQEADEMDCFKWAKEQTGFDPLNPTQVQAEQVETGPDGSAVKGAAKGAAAGAAIGAIAGDTGEGAAIGAVVGGLRGRRASKGQKQQQQAQANQAADAKEKEFMENYKKAFTACMEAKGYTVK
jgi:OmpA family protein